MTAPFRRRPTVDSPLADLIRGRIDQAEYVRRTNAKRARHGLPLLQPAEIRALPSSAKEAGAGS